MPLDVKTRNRLAKAMGAIIEHDLQVTRRAIGKYRNEWVVFADPIIGGACGQDLLALVEYMADRSRKFNKGGGK